MSKHLAILPAAVRRLLDGAERERAYAARERIVPKRRRPRCGARTRAGPPCKAPAVWDRENNRPRNGRCRMHGGLSTGPKTAAGGRRCADAGRGRKEDREHAGR